LGQQAYSAILVFLKVRQSRFAVHEMDAARDGLSKVFVRFIFYHHDRGFAGCDGWDGTGIFLIDIGHGFLLAAAPAAMVIVFAAQ
jgi:hypothetical protein